MPERPRNHSDATAYREAISQWQLAARTEVKRSSSLPSSMFDACDPMLEASLVDSVERMLNCLHEPRTEIATTEEQPEMRTEKVSPDELRELPKKVSGHAGELDIETGTRAEYLTLLVDTCSSADAETRLAAGQLLRRDFEIEPSDDLEATTRNLQRCLRQLLESNVPTAEQEQQLADLCQRIAACVMVQTTPPTTSLEP